MGDRCLEDLVGSFALARDAMNFIGFARQPTLIQCYESKNTTDGSRKSQICYRNKTGLCVVIFYGQLTR